MLRTCTHCDSSQRELLLLPACNTAASCTAAAMRKRLLKAHHPTKGRMRGEIVIANTHSRCRLRALSSIFYFLISDGLQHARTCARLPVRLRARETRLLLLHPPPHVAPARLRRRRATSHATTKGARANPESAPSRALKPCRGSASRQRLPAEKRTTN